MDPIATATEDEEHVTVEQLSTSAFTRGFLGASRDGPQTSHSDSAQRRASLIRNLPGAKQEAENTHIVTAREQDLDRMYERMLRARLTSDDTKLRAETAKRSGVIAGAAVAGAIVVALIIACSIRMSAQKRKAVSA